MEIILDICHSRLLNLQKGFIVKILNFECFLYRFQVVVNFFSPQSIKFKVKDSIFQFTLNLAYASILFDLFNCFLLDFD